MASKITKNILKLAGQIDSGGTPVCLALEGDSDMEPGCCMRNVSETVKRRGGSLQHGWSLREQPLTYVEGTFHAVWRSTNGSLVDVTPRADGQTQTIFLPDFIKVWEGEGTEPRRMFLHERACYCGSGLPFKVCCGGSDD